MGVTEDLQPTATVGPATNHVDSHRALLTEVRADRCGTAPLDAIVVPIARPAERLRTALDLAVRLGCPVLALCSYAATAETVIAQAAETDVELWAIDIRDDVPESLRPQLDTTAVLADSPLEYTRDTSVKRNLGLVVANAAGWRRVVFLDDDIHVPDHRNLGHAAFLLDRFTAVGLQIAQFPDNSVVCHAHRAGNGGQQTFIGTGALAVDPLSVNSFFPRIYNEDWFFLLDVDGLQPAAIVGSAKQESYDPYAELDRARLEEFGDTLAEGVFELLEDGKAVPDADEAYWEGALERRQDFIVDVIDRLPLSGRPTADQRQMRLALETALDVHKIISAELCANYVKAWLQDRIRWPAYLGQFRNHNRRQLGEVLAELELPARHR